MTPSPFEDRASGVLLHPTSLPGGTACGDLGPGAHRFLEFLGEARQRWWQMLPVHPPDVVGSPYLARSAFAGGAHLVGPAELAERGLLEPGEVAAAETRGPVDWKRLGAVLGPLLWRAFEAFESRDPAGERAEHDAFCAREAEWLEDWALFAALRRAHAGAPWTRWPEPLRRRDPDALAGAREEHAREVAFQRFLQYQFDRQWTRLREAAEARGVRLLGDLPLYVAGDSAEVWTRPELFHVDGDGVPVQVAGTPPDAFSADGQLWGNPAYRWEAHAEDGYAWWSRRVGHALRRFDALRLDHFIGFQRAWTFPVVDGTPGAGAYSAGPGRALFDALAAAGCGGPFVAEDLGDVSPEVEALRDELELPGMRILQFALGGEPGASPHLPCHHVPRSVVYPGTHDNDTVRGWYRSLPERARRKSPSRAELREVFRTDAHGVARDLVRVALDSVAGTAIVQMQDLLGLGTRARMNRPGTGQGNWRWRMGPRHPSAALAKRLARWTRLAGRG